ncbi:MAG: exodeoxyribonuclease VII large subunit [Firmicutes bacterium]|nr:exodeoxyribonuclease VII large subunit [Bacillota bacterium]
MDTFSVTDLTGYIKGLLESDAQLANLWVKGEISNYKQAVSGHVYFTLKDSDASIRTVMFRSRAKLLPFSPENGMAVRVRGYVTVFARDGQYQLYAEEIEPDGAGALYAAFENLKRQLAAEGLFDPERKQKLPLFPNTIGIVTSPTGAVVRDMLNILRRRWPLTRIILAPVAVQGEAAPAEIAAAIKLFNRAGAADLLIVGRGGGSLEELWAFNTEVVARSIAASQIPIISAVGHETDFTIADLVADLRAPTPSAAAEIAVPDQDEMKRNIMMLRGRLTRSIKHQTDLLRQRLNRCLTSRVIANPISVLCDQRRQILDWHERQIRRNADAKCRVEQSRLALLAGRLSALSPLATLSRGYSYTTGPDGKVLHNAARAAIGQTVKVYLYRGMLECRVENTVTEKPKRLHAE